VNSPNHRLPNVACNSAVIGTNYVSVVQSDDVVAVRVVVSIVVAVAFVTVFVGSVAVVLVVAVAAAAAAAAVADPVVPVSADRCTRTLVDSASNWAKVPAWSPWRPLPHHYRRRGAGPVRRLPQSVDATAGRPEEAKIPAGRVVDSPGYRPWTTIFAMNPFLDHGTVPSLWYPIESNM